MEAAVRELREETGYVPCAKLACLPHGLTATSPGMTGESVTIVEVEVDPVRKRRKLQGNEDIKVIKLHHDRRGGYFVTDKTVNEKAVINGQAFIAFLNGLILGMHYYRKFYKNHKGRLPRYVGDLENEQS